ncbi:MAG TPA: helix-turn-helix transcriptional regulator [Rhabdochlamydiaceae bacterium]|nr:helix-turn-helix transcriptional regulator [Rhabdochlamydiaceae bacterium]
METKKKTFIFNGLGFPVELIDCPMKKVIGEWVIDVDLNALQILVFKGLIHKPSPLTGRELRFMRKFMDLTTEEFGKKLGVTHASVIQWEKKSNPLAPVYEVYIRMLFFEMIKDKEINTIFKEINPQKLSETKHSQEPMSLNATELLKTA